MICLVEKIVLKTLRSEFSGREPHSGSNALGASSASRKRQEFLIGVQRIEASWAILLPPQKRMGPDLHISGLVGRQLHGKPVPDSLLLVARSKPALDRITRGLWHCCNCVLDPHWRVHCGYVGQTTGRDHFQLGFGTFLVPLLFD